jgi:hypothetical protein
MVAPAPTLDGVTYRQQCEAPTEPGWYYREVGQECEPTRVVRDRDGHLVCGYHGDGLPHYLGYHRWFGPVMTCREG